MASDVEAELPKGRISRQAFLAWVAPQPTGRYERIDGEVVRLASEMVTHARIEAWWWRALDRAMTAAGAACEALIDGVRVRIEDDHDYEPDALVNRGELAAGDQLYAPSPVIIVEVPSRSTRWLDEGYKLIDYFKIATVQHYLRLYGERRLLVHHRRVADGTVGAAIVHGGALTLDSPGIVLDAATMFQR